MDRGRPKKNSRLVTLVVMVPPEVKSYLKRSAEVQNVTMGAKAREILNWWYTTK